jgi:hypothetical protein
MIRMLRAILLVLSLAIPVPVLAAAADSPVDPANAAPVALITGSDRGLGFALTQELTARGVVDVIIRLDADRSGRFFSYTGTEIPW